MQEHIIEFTKIVCKIYPIFNSMTEIRLVNDIRLSIATVFLIILIKNRSTRKLNVPFTKKHFN